LADQLCTHVKDIDIYHTDKDRPEYNHGLFWHTQHYIESYTATHRCFSKSHSQFYDINAYGGGPALSHNYSGGFLFHYYMTGNPASKEAVLDMADFVINNIDMAGTLSRFLIDGLRQAKNIFKKNGLIQLYKVYELDGPCRASGNALNTLLNAYMLTNEKKYLEKADNLIYSCIHPDDDIKNMDLPDIENRWFYTIFLQALGRYLDTKKQTDDMWQYARLSLIHYASGLRERFSEKAEYFYEEAVKRLFQFKTKTLTRPVVLMMLNGMMYSYFKTQGINPVVFDESSDKNIYPVKNKGISVILKALQSFSLEKEIRFIKWRLQL